MRTLAKNALLVLVGLVLGGMVTSCSKDSIDLSNQATQSIPQPSAYSITLTGDGPVIDAVHVEHLKSTAANEPRYKAGSGNPNVIAQGKFSLASHGPEYLSVQFSTVQNNSGLNGQTKWTGSWMGDAVLETNWIMVEANTMVIGGFVTNASGFWFPEGWYFYYRVTDNGAGPNATSDQMHGQIFCAPTDLSEFLAPSSLEWAETDLDVDGQILVNPGN